MIHAEIRKIQWNSPVDCSLASARRCQLLTRCLSTGAANLQRGTAHLYLQGNCPLERSLASARRCQLLTRCLSTGAANLQRGTAHLYLQGNCPLERSLASARRCQLLTRCLSTGAANLSGSLRTKELLQTLAAALPFYIGISIFALIRHGCAVPPSPWGKA